ncbi:phage portal protein [Tardiphaga sp. vice304]|uniref:phage portal protein n=1 Tax=Tardiphaga sp. vice304 TaxID=2592817 RepID=UPI001162B6E9|nr:phage portal protein [Tardiphaga sp. vice304]QDM27577.1 phage portal protein [Tardiphaga sp. vice304]
MSATRQSLASRFQKFVGLETKAGLASPDAALFELFGALPSASGIRVTPLTAMTCAPVACAVNAISQAIGQLPIHVYQRGADGSKVRAPEHPVSRLLHSEPNPWTPASKFKEELVRDALLYRHGGFAEIVRVDGGKPFELIRINPETTPVTVGMSQDGPVYSVQESGKARPIDRQNILHLPSPSLSGMGLAHDAREAIGLLLVLERHANQLFANSARPSSILTVKGTGSVPPSADMLAKIKNAWLAAFGNGKSGGAAVLPSEVDWKPVTLSSVDAEFLSTFRFYIEQVSRHFRVPPHILYELGRATWGNSEEMNQQFLDGTLMHWISAFEGEVRLKLFDREERDTFYAEFLTDGFVRANYSARMEGLSKGIAARLINPNEARAVLNMPPYVGGDEFFNPHVQTAAVAS